MTITLDEWQAELAKHAPVDDPNALTTEQIAQKAQRSLSWAQRYVIDGLGNGTLRKVRVERKGRIMSAYVRVKPVK